MSKMRLWTFLLVAPVLGAGCGPGERPRDELSGGDEMAHELSAQLAAFRMEMESTMTLLAGQMERMQEEIRDDQRTHWEELSSRIRDAEEAARASLERLEAIDAADAQAARSEATEQIAQLESEVTLVELELAAQDREGLLARAEDKLRSLERDIEEIAQQVAEFELSRAPGAVSESPGQAPAEQTPFAWSPATAPLIGWERLEELYAELAALREEIARLGALPTDSPAFVERSELLPETVAELTREVKVAWYDAWWIGDGAM
jgi:chromosome segregation ATPase